VVSWSIQTSFQPGDLIVCSPHGVGKILAVEEKGSAGNCFILSFGSQLRVFLPIGSADRMMRRLASKEEAERDLELLRGECGPLAPKKPREVRQEQDRVLRSGSRDERTRALRSLYATGSRTSDSNTRAIQALEDLVLAEIAAVLNIPRTDLDNEMRERYPLTAKSKKS
jgi:RNA polymerase-interacting CarD/CdnL/TRCF family regulator